jgi:hypothetical protein
VTATLAILVFRDDSLLSSNEVFTLGNQLTTSAGNPSNLPSTLLLKKLKFYGVSGKFYQLVTSYLGGKYQKVSLNHNTSIGSN